MIGFSWTHLGAFVNAGVNLTDERIEQFAAAAGRWIVVYFDQLGRDNGPDVEWNRDHVDELRQRFAAHSVRLGGCFVGWGGDPETDADTITAYVKQHRLAPVVLDLEGAYQGNTLLAQLTNALRATSRLPVGTVPIGVSTNSLNDSQVFNGRRGSSRSAADHSFRTLRIAVLPQWYNSPAYAGSPWTDPVENMTWLEQHGTEDNLHDDVYPDGRAVRLDQVKPTLEVTGLENADLEGECEACLAAQPHGLTRGCQLYLLENAPDSDLPLIARYRGRLFT